MKSIHIQYLLAGIFIGLGGWCLLFPGMVEKLVLKPEYQVGTVTSALLIGCFGAQAVLAGTLIGTCRFTPRTFLVFGLTGSVPFFVFNVWFYFVKAMFTPWMLLDFVGNVAILGLCLYGYRRRRWEDHAAWLIMHTPPK